MKTVLTFLGCLVCGQVAQAGYSSELWQYNDRWELIVRISDNPDAGFTLIRYGRDVEGEYYKRHKEYGSGVWHYDGLSQDDLDRLNEHVPEWSTDQISQVLEGLNTGEYTPEQVNADIQDGQPFFEYLSEALTIETLVDEAFPRDQIKRAGEAAAVIVASALVAYFAFLVVSKSYKGF